VAAIHPDDLAASVTASAQALGGNGPELHQLIAQLSTLITGVEAQHDDLAATLDNLSALGTKLAPLDQHVGSLIDSAAATTKAVGADTHKLVTAVGAFDDVASTINRTILEPHADELAALLREASIVVGSISKDQNVLGRMADSFALFVPRITKSISKGQLLVFTWIDLDIKVAGRTLADVLPGYMAQLVDP
jgi:hypothetical protein